MTSDRTCSKKNQKYTFVEKTLRRVSFAKHERASGFSRRKSQKITGKHLLLSFMSMAMQGRNSFQHWAQHLSILTGNRVSRQGIWKRVTASLTHFLVAVMFDVLKSQTSSVYRQANQQACLKKYKRVLVQDSTTISLPDALGWCFAGNYSRGKKKAVLKIQAIYDLLSNRFIHFEITPYTDNDQSKSNDILSIATKGDLVIRDLGYFVLKSFDGMRAQNISFISRLKFGVNIYPSTTSKKINLLQTIRSTGSFDQWVFLGSEQKVATRMVVLQMSQEQSDKRRRNAKQDRDKRLNHNQEYYDMLGYNVFITTEPASNLSAKQIAKLYGWRWRIESIFKCWKSHFNLQKIIPKNTSLTKERTEAIIHMMLIFILLLQVNLYNLVLKEAKKTSDKIISLIKLCQYIAHHFDCLLTQNLHVLMPEIIYYCCYDTRHDRLNYTQKMMLG